MRKVLAALLLSAAVTGAMPQAHAATITIASLGRNDADVRGMHGATSFFVPIPPGTRVSGPVVIDVEFSHSPLVLADVSTMTVRVNGSNLASTFLDAANANHGHLLVDVPGDIIGSDGMFVEARFFMRLTRDTCEEPDNPALWATVHGASVVTLPTAFAGPRDVANIPELVVPATPADRPLTVVVPSRPNESVLQAAAIVGAAAGSWLGAAGRDAVVTTASEAPLDAPSIQVGLMLDVPGVDVGAARRGVIAISQDGPVRVFVTGPTAKAVLAAARALSFVNRLHGPAVVLTGARPAANPKRSAPWTSSAASFTQLGIDAQEAAGPGTTRFDLVVERPAGWKLARTAHIDLIIDTAPGVRRGPSFVAVRANGFDLGSRRLEPGEGAHTYRFDAAGGLLDRDLRGRPHRTLRLQVRVHLAPEQRNCVPVDADSVHATVLPTSKITLPHTTGDRLDVGRFPSSLENPTIIVDGNGAAAVALAVQAAASIGRWNDAADLSVADAASWRSPRGKNTDLVVLTKPRTIDGQLAIAGRPAARTSEPVVALAALKPSPFATDHTALVVDGGGEGPMTALRAFGSLAAMENVGGKVVAVSAGSTKAQTVVAENGAAPPVELAPVLTRSRIRNETIVGAVLLAAFLASILLVIRFRWRSPRS